MVAQRAGLVLCSDVARLDIFPGFDVVRMIEALPLPSCGVSPLRPRCSQLRPVLGPHIASDSGSAPQLGLRSSRLLEVC